MENENLVDVRLEDPQTFDYGQVILSKKIIGFFSHVSNQKYYFNNAKYLPLVLLQDFKNERMYKGRVRYLTMDRNKLKELNDRFSEYQTTNKGSTFDSNQSYASNLDDGHPKADEEVNGEVLVENDPAPPCAISKRGLTEYLNKCKGSNDDPKKFRVKTSAKAIKALGEIINLSSFKKFSKSFLVWRVPGDTDIFHIQLKKSSRKCSVFHSRQYGYVFEDLFVRQAYENENNMNSRSGNEGLVRYSCSESTGPSSISNNSNNPELRKQFSVISSWEFPEFYLDYRHEMDAFACSSIEDTREKLLTLGPQVEPEHLSSFLALLQCPVEMKIRKEGRFEDKFNHELLAELSSELVLTNSTLLLGLWDEKSTKDGEEPIDFLKEVICSEDAKEWDSKISNPKGPAALNFVYNFIMKVCETVRADEEAADKENEEMGNNINVPKKPRKKMNKKERRNKVKGACQRGHGKTSQKDYVFTFNSQGFYTQTCPSRQMVWSSQPKKDTYWRLNPPPLI